MNKKIDLSLILTSVYVFSTFVFSYIMSTFFSTIELYMLSFIITLSSIMLVKDIKIKDKSLNTISLIIVSVIIFILSNCFTMISLIIYLNIVLCILSYKLCTKYIEDKKIVFITVLIIQLLFIGIMIAFNFDDFFMGAFQIINHIPIVSYSQDSIFYIVIQIMVAYLLFRLVFKFNIEKINLKILTSVFAIVIVCICIFGIYINIFILSELNITSNNFNKEKENLKNARSMIEINNIVHKIIDQEIYIGSGMSFAGGNSKMGFFLMMPYIGDTTGIVKEDKKFTSIQLKASKDLVDKFSIKLPEIKNEILTKVIQEVYFKYIPIEIVISSIIYLISICMLKNRVKE